MQPLKQKFENDLVVSPLTVLVDPERLDDILDGGTSGLHTSAAYIVQKQLEEAVLGWLNTTLILQGKSVNWDSLAEILLKELSNRFDTLKSAVGHVKLLIEAGDQYVIGNLTGKKESLNIRGSAGLGNEAKMILNARVEMSPAELENIVSEVVSEVCSEGIIQKVEASKCLRPGRPNPTHRYDYVVT